ncbi:MAG: HipA domain-containing protein [Hyphomonadaceae bacterium]|nr:HipA domain-containing protein [Hyphomonadaceae bacterium]
MPDVSTLNVMLHGTRIATLTNVGGDRTIFAFTEDYIRNRQRPVLGLRFKDALGELITEFAPTQTSLIPWFSNLLPEGPLRKYLAERARVNQKREFFLLWALGKDLPGAVTIEPAEGEAWPPSAHDGHDEPFENASANALRFSLAGVQLKFSALEDARGGLAIPARGMGGDWIVKLPSREHDGVPENEFSMMTLARKVGIDVPAIQLVDLNAIANLPETGRLRGAQAFVIQRFDRLASGPVHMEDFAQVFDVYPDDKYKTATMRRVAGVIAAEGADSTEFVRRMVFNALIGNADMHLKNWSLIYPDQRRTALAPAYDFLSTTPYIKDDKSALKVSRSARFDEFTRDELVHFAAKARLPERVVLDTAAETVALFHQQWKSEAKNLPMAKDVIAAVEHQLRIVPIAND